jgi:hypothetical protein
MIMAIKAGGSSASSNMRSRMPQFLNTSGSRAKLDWDGYYAPDSGWPGIIGGVEIRAHPASRLTPSDVTAGP